MMKKITTAMGLVMGFLSFGATAECYKDTIQPTTDTVQYLVNDDGSILDVSSGLTWSQCLYGQEFNVDTGDCDGAPKKVQSWEVALAAQESVEGDWRLPNIKELATLVEYSCVEPSINTDVFSNTPSAPFWTNTPNSDGFGETEGKVVDFTSGAEGVENIDTSSVYIRFVKR